MARYNPKVQSLGNFWTRRAIFKIKTALESPSHYAHFGVRHVALRRAAPKLSRRKAEKMVQSRESFLPRRRLNLFLPIMMFVKIISLSHPPHIWMRVIWRT